MTTKRVCMICNKPCEESDQNTDGTFAHAECLRPYSTSPVSRSEKGGNLYPGTR